MSTMMDKKLKWRHLKALHQIYEHGYTKNKIKKQKYISYLLRNGLIKTRIGYPNILEQGLGFKELYLKEHLVNFQHYHDFLSENKVLINQSNYSESDIKILIFIKNQKEQILSDKYSRRKLSALFFKKEGAKHLDKNDGLEKAVLSILGIPTFPGNDPKDYQYKFVLDCPSPRLIVLCENIAFLLEYWVAWDNDIELWYAGGNNIEKLDHLPKIQFPIFYSCDWDYHGLRIYERIKAKIPQIELLFPSGVNERKSVYSSNHKSDWVYSKSFSGLQQRLYSQPAYRLINELITAKEWIEEESNDLLKMLN